MHHHNSLAHFVPAVGWHPIRQLFFLKSASTEQRLAGHSILTTPRYWWVGQILSVLSGVVQGFSQVNGLYLLIFLSALRLYSLLSVALKRAMKDLTHVPGDQSTTACSVGDGW